MLKCYTLSVLIILSFAAPIRVSSGDGDTAKGAGFAATGFSERVLWQIAQGHLALARGKGGNSELFELAVSNVDAEALMAHRPSVLDVTSSFTLPDDHAWYLKIQEIKSIYGGPNGRAPWVGKAGFILKVCDQGYVLPEMRCGQYTGEPEQPGRHLPIRNWRIDLPEILEALRNERFPHSKRMGITITTVGRIKPPSRELNAEANQTSEITRQLKSLSENDALITVTGWSNNQGSKRAHYIVIKADDGSVIARGDYTLSPVLKKP